MQNNDLLIGCFFGFVLFSFFSINNVSIFNQRAEGRDSIRMLELLLKCHKRLPVLNKEISNLQSINRACFNFPRYCITSRVQLCKRILNLIVAVQLYFVCWKKEVFCGSVCI